MKKKKRVRILSIWIFLLFFFPSLGEAEGLDFSVRALPNDTQLGEQTGYFHLLVAPEEAQTLQVEVVNLSSKKQTIEMIPVDATTGANGGIQYTPEIKGKQWTTDRVSFTEYVKKQTIELKGKERKVIKIPLQAMKEEVSGSLLGGLVFQKKEKEKEETGKNTVINYFSIALAVQLQAKEQNEMPNFEIDEVRTGFVDGYLRVVETLSQTTNEVLSHVTIHSSIKKKGASVNNYEKVLEDVSIAPNSKFEIYLTDENQVKTIKAGAYEIETIIRVGEQSQTIKKEIIINDIVPQEPQLDQTPDKNSWVLYIGIGILSSTGIGAGIYWYLKRRHKK